MEQYWNTRLVPTKPTNLSDAHADNTIQPNNESILSDFDRHRLTLLSNQAELEDEGWQSEMCQYLKDLPADVTKDTDIMKWWQVCAGAAR